MKNIKISAVLTFALFFSAFSLFAQGNEVKTVAGAKSVQQMHGMQGLKLTDEQKQKVQQLNLDQQKQNIKINSEIQLNRVEIKKLFTEKALDTKKLASLTENNGKLELQIKTLKTENWITIYNLLNDDQKITWKKHFQLAGMMRDGKQMGMAQGMGRGMGQGRMEKGMMHDRRPGMMSERKPGMVQGHMMKQQMTKKDSLTGKK